jgi:hypothetical protein
MATPSVEAGQPAQIRVDAAPGSTVRVFAYSRPSTSYRQVREGVVGPDGAAVFTVRPGGNTRAYAELVGCGAQSVSTTMNVRTTMTLAARRLGSRQYLFSGQAVPGRPGQIISLYAGRTLLAQGRTDQRGRYAITRTFQRGARMDLHAFAGRNITADEGRSRTRPTVVH